MGQQQVAQCRLGLKLISDVAGTAGRPQMCCSHGQSIAHELNGAQRVDD